MLQGAKLTLAPLVWRFLRGTIRLDPLSESLIAEQQPLLFCCLHRDILPAIMHVRPARPVLLVSQSPDGEILRRTLGESHYSYVRGATGEDGKRAFMELSKVLAAGRSVGVAVDGPKGPFGVIHEGVLQLARLSGAVIMPLVADCSHGKNLNTWDRTLVPLPFSRVVFRYGSPLTIGRSVGKAELEEAKMELARFFQVTEENS